MRKQLLKNENVGKIAEDPKKLAFLRAIEDRDGSEDFDFLDRQGVEDSFYVEMETPTEGTGSGTPTTDNGGAPAEAMEVEGQDTREQQPLQPTKPTTTNTMRPPANKRRTPAAATGKRPSTLAEIKQSLSYLVEEPGTFYASPSSDSGSDNENGGSDFDVDDGVSHISDSQRSTSYQPSNSNSNSDSAASSRSVTFSNPRRTNTSSSSSSANSASSSSSSVIVDRLLLKRQSSSSLSSLAGDGSNTMAFHNPSASSSTSSFVPSLLRRATTNSSLTNTGEGGGVGVAATTERMAGGEKAVKISKRISVNFRKREGEKARIVGKGERRRREEREKMARGGKLGGLARGTWES